MTTESPTVAEEMVLRIRERPHWRVLIEPQVFKQRFQSPSAALGAVQASRVHLRGWDFPHVGAAPSGGNEASGLGWSSWSEFKDLEAWLITTSGQFIHYLTLREDRPSLQATDGPVLVFESTVYQLTEIFEFARRLTATADYEPRVRVEVGLRGMEGRALGRQTPDGPLEPFGPFASYACTQPALLSEVLASPLELRFQAPEMARFACLDLFQGFGFRPSDRVIRDLQEKLLARAS